MARIEFLSSCFHYSFGPHAPALTIQPGASILVTCADCDNMMSDGSELNAEQRNSNDTTNPIQGNPLAGPIHVDGAERGDMVAVTIDSVELDRDSGITLLASDHGVVPSKFLISEYGDEDQGDSVVPRHMYRWSIDTAASTATMVNPLGGLNAVVPLDPFVGCLGVCPPNGEAVSSLYCGSFGGNLDLPLIRAGSTVYLPVYQEGALLLMGDIHAAQGHGEIIGGGIETSGKIGCTIRLLKLRPIGVCGVLDNESLSAIGTDSDLRQSVQQACGGLVNWLALTEAMNRFDLYNLVSQTVSITLGNLNQPPYPAAASIRLSHLPAPLREALHRWSS